MDEHETNERKYETPSAILKWVNLQFAESFLMKAKEKFGDNTDYTCIYLYLTSSCGVSEAFKEACAQAKKPLLKKYEESLEWWEWDVFMSDVFERCINLVIEADLDIARRIKVCEGVLHGLPNTTELQG